MEQALLSFYGDDPQIDYILNQVELVVHRGLQRLRGEAGGAFLPELGQAEPTRLKYAHEARTAEELRQTPEGQKAIQEPQSHGPRNSSPSVPWV